MLLALFRNGPTRMLELVVFPLLASIIMPMAPDIFGPVWILFAHTIVLGVMDIRIARVCSTLPCSRAGFGRLILALAAWTAAAPFAVALVFLRWGPLADAYPDAASLLSVEAVIAVAFVARLLTTPRTTGWDAPDSYDSLMAVASARRPLDMAFTLLVFALPALRLLRTGEQVHHALQMALLLMAAPISVYYLCRIFANAGTLAYSLCALPEEPPETQEEIPLRMRTISALTQRPGGTEPIRFTPRVHDVSLMVFRAIVVCCGFMLLPVFLLRTKEDIHHTFRILLLLAAPISVYFLFRILAISRTLAHRLCGMPGKPPRAREQVPPQVWDISSFALWPAGTEPMRFPPRIQDVLMVAFRTILASCGVMLVVLAHRPPDSTPGLALAPLQVSGATLAGIVLLRQVLVAMLSLRSLRALPITARHLANRMTIRIYAEVALQAIAVAAPLACLGRADLALRALCFTLALPSAGTLACCAYAKLRGDVGFVAALLLTFASVLAQRTYPIPLAAAGIGLLPVAYWLLLRVVAGTPNASLPRVS